MIKKCLLLALFTLAAPALASTFLVSINTSAFSGVTGSLFFSFGPGAPPFDAATANGREADLRAELDALFNAQNTSEDATSIPATFLRVTVAL